MHKIIPQYQTPGDNQCGQVCVAMLVDMPRAHICALMDKWGTTRTKDLVRILKYYGYEAGPRAITIKCAAPLPGNAILKYRWEGRSMGHWVLIWGGKFFDPAGMGVLYSSLGPGRFTSY